MRALIVLFGAFSLTACASLIGTSRGYDERSFTIINFNIFNQRQPSALSKKNWKGDWLFRRERLELVDEQLRVTRPDVVVLQEATTRLDSPSESDMNILSAGALEGYEWDATLIADHRDTQESQFNAVAVGLPVKLVRQEEIIKKSWPISVEGSMSYSLLELDGSPILLVNLQMPETIQKADAWYQSVTQEIKMLQEQVKVCSQRLIVAGHIPGSGIWPGYSQFIADLGLRDTASGFCEAASDCLTTSPQNDLFAAIGGGASGSHSERILVHQEVIVFSSGISMQKIRPISVNGPQYGIHRLWASPRFAWESELRLPKCD